MTVADWLAARRQRDDRGAIDVTLRLLASGDCPLPVRLALPNSWRRARGLDDLDDLLDSLFTWPGTRGPDRALLAVASGRLHPAALATTDAIDPRMLLLAAGQAALSRGASEAALALLPPALPRPSALIDQAAACEVAFALGQSPPQRMVRPPPSPPFTVAVTIATTLSTRAHSQLASGRPVEALGLAELGLATCPDGSPPALPASLLALITRLRLDLDDIAGATRCLDTLDSLLPAVTTGLRHEAGALRVRWLLEQQRVAEAAQLMEQLVTESSPDDPGHLDLRLLAASLPLTQPAPVIEPIIADLRAILDAARRQPARPDAAAAASHWLGVWRTHQPAHSIEARGHLLDALAHRSGLGSTHPARVETLLALAVLHGHQGEIDEGERCAREALSAIEQSVGSWHPLARVASTCLASLAAARSARLHPDALRPDHARPLQPLAHRLRRVLLAPRSAPVVTRVPARRGARSHPEREALQHAALVAQPLARRTQVLAERDARRRHALVAPAVLLTLSSGDEQDAGRHPGEDAHHPPG